jgi:uncharacterized protein (TIGR00369 family)
MDEEWAQFLRQDFVQGFPAYCGYEVDLVGDGEFHTSLKVRPDHKQQDGFVHAGVIATMADHTAGYAAFTTVTPEFRILTIEFKINYFRPATDDTIVCRSKVINRGKKIIVSESEISSVSGKDVRLVSKAMVTLMAVPAANLSNAQTGGTL